MSDSLIQEPLSLIVRILFAAALGGLLGLERDIHGRAAGLRTHLLVSAGSAVFMVLSLHIATLGQEVVEGYTRVTDPGRIAAQIVTGIGFLGAGAIIKEGLTIRGLTTAACLWISAAIGMCAGLGFYLIAVSTTAIALFSLVILRYFERAYNKDVYRAIVVSMPIEFDISKVINIVKSNGIKILFFDYERDYENKTITAKMSLRFIQKGNVDKLSHGIIRSLETCGIPIKSVKWTHL